MVDTAVAAEKLGTLAAALTEAKLANALKDDGPPFTDIRTAEEAFTAAWEALGITAEELLASEALADILKLHVTPGAMAMCTDLKTRERKGGSLRGSELTVILADGKITVKDVMLTAADVVTSNGVIHNIVKVLLPPSDLAEAGDTAVAAGKFGILAAAQQRSSWWVHRKVMALSLCLHQQMKLSQLP